MSTGNLNEIPGFEFLFSLSMKLLTLNVYLKGQGNINEPPCFEYHLGLLMELFASDVSKDSVSPNLQCLVRF